MDSVKFHTNMRVHLCGDLLAGAFAKQILAIGDCKFPIHSNAGVTQLPDTMSTA